MSGGTKIASYPFFAWGRYPTFLSRTASDLKQTHRQIEVSRCGKRHTFVNIQYLGVANNWYRILLLPNVQELWPCHEKANYRNLVRSSKNAKYARFLLSHWWVFT